MKIDDILNDIVLLKGKSLGGVKPGVAIEVIDVTDERVIYKTASGKQSSTSLSKLGQLVEGLAAKSVIHVDSELKGSGSSRNQPETILANLPYFEVVYIGKKKHLAVATTRHPLGSIQMATPERTAELKKHLDGA